MNDPDEAVRRRLESISTRWGQLGDPVQFLFRYGSAIRQYLSALLKNPEDVEDITQDIVMRVVKDGFANADPEKGRFRNYLKTAVRNAALMHLRRRLPAQLSDSAAERIEAAEPEATEAWLADWRKCALARAWRAVEWHEKQTSGNLFATALRLKMDHPKSDSTALAGMASEKLGRPIKEAAFRKQLSRARKLFAELLVEEVRRTLEGPTAEAVRDELIEVGLMPWVKGYVDVGSE